ncbi:hypothetical protein HOE67_03845 [Candidatus Peregrinibacteria bacterium]|jgi:hypothetical protein|nr:hypothetical protein [Candidatus Peregrinibacteria bacterium]
MTFLQELEQLRLSMPRLGLQTVNNTNSPFCQYTERSKNCYMTFASYQSEDCYYNTRVFYCTDCIDCTLSYKSTLCYESVDCINSYNCDYCIYCENATDCSHCHHCIGVQNCFGCVGLQRKEHQIFNVQYSKEEYEEHLPKLKKMSEEELKAKIAPLLTSVPRMAMYGKHNENSYGENIHNCKNVYWGFDSKKIWDGLYIYHCDESKNLYDCSHLGWSELDYEIMSGGGLNDCMFCYGSWDSNNLTYCDSVFNSHDCFGCVGLSHGEYQILNKKYEKEEYFKKVEEIKAQMQQDNEWGQWYDSTYEEVLTYGL